VSDKQRSSLEMSCLGHNSVCTIETGRFGQMANLPSVFCRFDSDDFSNRGESDQLHTVRLWRS